MATVVSLTEDKIRELLSGYEGVALKQSDIDALVQQIKIDLASNQASVDELNNVTIPQLRIELADNDSKLADLNTNTLPQLQIELDQANADINDLNTVDLPSLRADLDSTSQNVLDMPKAYYTATAPLNPDDDLRDLVVGDTWFDPNDNNKQYTWNGTEWSTLSVDVADFSLTAQKFKTSTHMIY